MIEISKTKWGNVRIEIAEGDGASAVEYLDVYGAKELVKEILDAMIRESE